MTHVELFRNTCPSPKLNESQTITESILLVEFVQCHLRGPEHKDLEDIDLA